jgi:hypothetical protein
MHTYLINICTARRILFTFCIQDFNRPMPVPCESAHSSTKITGTSNRPQNTMKTAPIFLAAIQYITDINK